MEQKQRDVLERGTEIDIEAFMGKSRTQLPDEVKAKLLGFREVDIERQIWSDQDGRLVAKHFMLDHIYTRGKI